MEIGGCCFPNDLLYDTEGLTWVRIDQGRLTLGLTQFHVFKIGKIVSTRIKGQGTELHRGSSVAFVETVKYVGHARTPVSGVIEEINNEVSMNPTLVNKDPYGKGWIAKLRPTSLEDEREGLSDSKTISGPVTEFVSKSGLRCFSVYPEYHVSGIGGECPETLRALDDLLKMIGTDEAVLLVTDNPKAEMEVRSWVSIKEYVIVESRIEEPLKYYIIGRERVS